MTEGIQVFSGECTTEFEGTVDQTRCGTLLVIVKPDNTVLVHDAVGYQPTAWLTRPEATTVDRERGIIEAQEGDQRLCVRFHSLDCETRATGSLAGIPVGTTERGETLIRARETVIDLGTNEEYPLPRGATVLDEPCESCGLPLVAVDRGEQFEICLDPACESLVDAVLTFDRAWSCPSCGEDLRVRHQSESQPRSGFVVQCDSARTCETNYAFPSGFIVGTCACGLPQFETNGGVRCLHPDCEGTAPSSDIQ